MAIGAEIRINAYRADPTGSPVSVKGSVCIAHDDLTQTAETTNLLRPALMANSNFHWVRLGENIGRVMIRSRMPIGSNITTSPVVRPIVAIPVLDGSQNTCNATISAGALPDDGTVIFARTDTTAFGDAGITLTLSKTANRDATYGYGPWVMLSAALVPQDCFGGCWIGFGLEVAAVINTGTVQLQLWAMN